MGKKTNHTNTEAPVKRAAKIKPVAEKIAVPKPEVPKPAAKKPAAAAKSRATKPVAPGKKAPAYSQDDVALRAYFIAERRLKAGLPGDSHQDWIEAERQLASETGKLVARPSRKKG